MTPERWQQVKELFNSALERDAAERSSFLDHACAGDQLLRKAVDDLLSSDERTHVMIDQPVLGLAADLLAEHRSPSVIGRTIGPYKFVEEVGRGGMGEVYLAHDTRLGRPVAIKLLLDSFIHDSERVRRFQQEARAASLLNHPNIVTIHEVVESDGLRFIISEFVQGKTLREVINEGLKVDQALDVVIQTASALSAAHNAGIVHRDIKPENIMVRPDGYVKVLDFGLAKLTERRQAPGSLQEDTAAGLSEIGTKPGTVMGTVKYMSPEQARGEKVDRRTDIFSLGVVLYETITGRAPFNGETASHTIVAILEQEPSPVADYVPDAPAELQRILDNALSKKREDRYQTVGEMMNDLKEVREEVAYRARQERRSGSSGEVSNPGAVAATQIRIRGRRSRAMLWASIMLAAASALAFAVYEYTRARRAPNSTSSVKMSRITANGKISKIAFSPDGKYMAYAAGPRRMPGLWVMQINTRSHTQLIPPAEGVDYWELTFSPDGDYIYYVAFVKSEEELHRVPALGGTPKRILTRIDSSVTFSPDGARIAFLRDIPHAGESHLVVANTDGSDERVLAARKLPEYFLAQAIGVKISWSPDGETIACPAGNNDLASGASMDAVGVSLKDGTQRPLTRRRFAEVTEAVWLVDGSGLVICAKEQLSSTFQVWRLSYPEGEVSRLTNDFSRYFDISITGDSIAVVQEDPSSQIWIAPDADAARARKITDSRSEGQGISWTPDGKVVYCSYVSGNADIWIMDSEGGNRKQLTDDPGFDAWPEVSPDGRNVVFISSRAGDAFHVWRMDIDGGNLVQLTNGSGEISPCFSPDGRWVYYISSRSEGRFGPLWKIQPDGGEPVLVIDKLTGLPSVSSDPKVIAYFYVDTQATPPQGIAVAPVEGGPPLTRLVFRSMFRWTPDGHEIAYVDSLLLNIWAQPLDGGKPVQLTDFKTDLIRWFAWSRDGKQLALARGTITSDVVMINDFK